MFYNCCSFVTCLIRILKKQGCCHLRFNFVEYNPWCGCDGELMEPHNSFRHSFIFTFYCNASTERMCADSNYLK